jgi:hypothetical protein
VYAAGIQAIPAFQQRLTLKEYTMTKTTLTRWFTSALAGAVMLVALPSLAAAQHYMVSPASCQPAESSSSSQSAATSASRLYLINGVWTFRAGQSGSAELACPINFSGAQGEWSMMQLWYRDGYAANNAEGGFVEADLMRRSRGGAGSTLMLWVASNIGTDEYGFIPVNNPPQGPGANTAHEVAFVGFEIRF